MRVSILGTMATILLTTMTIASANGPVSWEFDEATTGEDIAWTSRTGVDPGAPRYLGAYVLEDVFVTVLVFGFPIEVNVTDQIPSELLAGGEVVLGPAPIVLLAASLLFPEPPEPPGLGADLLIGIDENGFGFFDATNVFLGSVDIGFGAEILGIRVAGGVEVTPNPSDLDCSGTVDILDLLAVLAGWGGPGGDVDGDGVTTVTDLLQMLADWG